MSCKLDFHLCWSSKFVEICQVFKVHYHLDPSAGSHILVWQHICCVDLTIWFKLSLNEIIRHRILATWYHMVQASQCIFIGLFVANYSNVSKATHSPLFYLEQIHLFSYVIIIHNRPAYYLGFECF